MRHYTHDEVIKAAEDAVLLFIEYRDVHGFNEQDARLQALAEVAEGTAPATYDSIDEMHAWQRRGEE